MSVRPRRPDISRVPLLRIDTNVVLIPVTVTDPSGTPVAGIPRQSFRILEDDVEQSLRYFSAQDAPISATILFDASGSMGNKLEASREAVADFLQMSMPGDEFSLIKFSDNPTMVQGLTEETKYVAEQLPSIQAKGWTALFDAIYMGVQDIRHGKNARKVMLILSDGGDNNSRYTENEMKNIVMESDVCVYSIGLLGSGMSKHNIKLLSRMSEATGGRFYGIERIAELRDVVGKINADIRNQYLLGYTPLASPQDGKYRHVTVRLEPPPGVPPLRASWRTGYYSPAP